MVLLHKVSPLLLQTESNRPFFVPKVVSIGPYHHGDAHLAGMEPLKKQASEKFYTAARQRVRAVAERVRGMYEMDPRIKMDDEEFADMLFLDACFVVHFISSYQGFVVRDLFLLENQLPYEVLKAVKPDPSFDETLANFIYSVSRNNNLERARDAVKKVKEAEMKREMLQHPKSPDEIRIDMSGAHTGNLLDMLHQMLVSRSKIWDGRGGMDLWGSLNFRSVKELKEAGIKFELNKNGNLTYENVNYNKEGYLFGIVCLPRMTVDDSTKSNFLNLVALEMDPEGGTRGYGVISYICLLDNLIDHADDVRELRSKGILINCLGSDQQVADLFNELATNLTPDPNAYRDTITGIHNHLKKDFKVSIARANYTHFNTPWSFIATFAATLGLGFSAVQAFK